MATVEIFNVNMSAVAVATAAAIAKLQTQVNELSTPKLDVSPSPPSDNLMDREQRLWDAI
ncbi:hypothetical protein DSO57_1013723 [Entomophthora muscae]|uniref:Uncharacterized protein n=1 Tax=Entomophthora muscae TaxID=34485 RepID=A0ACC2UG24_9FUNG|nr:hypothetical protein DSO57_1013723 [Entomophthora muscae]